MRIDKTIFIMDGTNECFNRDVQKETLKGYFRSTKRKAKLIEIRPIEYKLNRKNDHGASAAALIVLDLS